MFENVFDMSVKQTKLQALGFYIVYLIIGLIAVGLLCASIAAMYCMFSGVCTDDNAYEIGRKIGSVVGIVSCFVYILGIGSWIVFSKKLYKKASAMVLYVLAILLTVPFGAVGALIPLAVLTTFDNYSAEENNSSEQNNELSE